SSLFLTRPAAAALFTLSLHDALPISLPSTARSDRASGWSSGTRRMVDAGGGAVDRRTDGRGSSGRGTPGRRAAQRASAVSGPVRSEEHTSELQSRENLVCRLLLEKKK